MEEELIEYLLKQRMYCLTLYNLSPIQQGIQSLHATHEYARENNSKEFLKWRDEDKTVIVLSAGSSFGLMNAKQQLLDNNIKFSEFVEPDLYNQVTAICFLADERVWDREKYFDLELHQPYIIAKQNGRSDLVNKIENSYIESIGGAQNYFLRSYLPKYRLA